MATDGKAVSALLGTCIVMVLFIVLAVALVALGVAQIVIGAMNIHECPREYLIPIYLIVSGVTGFSFAFFSGTISACSRQQQKQSEDGEVLDVRKRMKNPFLTCIHGILMLFALAWFIFGNVIVFRSRGDYTGVPSNGTDPILGEEIDPMYCKPLVMEFAFGTIIVAYATMGLVVVGGCLACCIMCCCAAALSE